MTRYEGGKIKMMLRPMKMVEREMEAFSWLGNR